MQTQITYLFLNMSGGEIFIVMLFVLMFFGAESIPKIARTLGRGLRQVRDATEEIKKDIQKSASETGMDIKKDIDQIKDPFKDIK